MKRRRLGNLEGPQGGSAGEADVVAEGINRGKVLPKVT